MEDDFNLIEKILNTIKSTQVPLLKEDFDAVPISNEDFNEYKEFSDQQIKIILDIFYQHESLLTNSSYDNIHSALKVNILLMASEQLEINPYYSISNQHQLISLEKLISSHVDNFEDVIFTKTIQVFKDTLNNEDWKKNLGRIYGFSWFTKFYLNFKTSSNEDFLVFALSVASKLISIYDPEFKKIGLKIFSSMLELGDKTAIKKINIHSVIFDEVHLLMDRSTDIEFNEYLYNSIFIALTLDDSIKMKPSTIEDTKWCKLDDVIEKLLHQVTINRDQKFHNFLLYETAKFCGINSNIKLMEIEKIEGLNEIYFNELKNSCCERNIRLLRWLKPILQLIREELNASSEKFVVNILKIIYTFTMHNFEEEFKEYTISFD